MNLEKLLALLQALDAKIDALLANDELTDEQQTEHDAHVAEREKLTKKIELERDRLAREDQRQKLADEAEQLKKPKGRKTDPDPPVPDDVPADRAGANRLPATVKRHGSLKFFQGTRHGLDADVRAYRYGMWALAQLSIQMPGRYRFNQAVEFFEKQWGAVHQSNNATGVHNLIPVP